jgi:tRNA (guanine37-N1)-methyltransferase
VTESGPANADPGPGAPRPIRFDILTLFPEMFGGVLGSSICGRAAEGGFASYVLHDIRAWAANKHAKVDDRPFGGGPGMVMMCQPLFDCVQAVEAMDERPTRRILLSPQGRRLTQDLVEGLVEPGGRLLLIAGHYEGVDERVIDALEPQEFSVGDYVLSGGELAAMVLIDAVVRLLPGVLGHEDSAAEDSFATREWPAGTRSATTEKDDDDAGGGRTVRLLDCPHYTRPRVWNGRAVPDVLLSGDHEAVARWRWDQMLERTRRRRPDLLEEDVRDPWTDEAG